MLVLVENSIYFKFILYALHDCLTELSIEHLIIDDYDCDFNYNDTDIYLLFTTHESLRPTIPKRYISYNFEQLISNYYLDNTDVFDRFRNAELVLDYSLENIKFLKQQYDIDAHFLPLGFNKNMVFDTTDNLTRYIDFTFVGKFNDSRYDKLMPLARLYNDCFDRLAMIKDQCWGYKLEYLHTHTKIGLNIHYYNTGKSIFEIARIILYLANKVIVITERSDDEWYDNKFKNLVYFFKNKNYSIDCINVLQEYNIEKAEKNYQELITNHKYINYVKDIIHLFQNLKK
jgi:hypothetical protein